LCKLSLPCRISARFSAGLRIKVEPWPFDDWDGWWRRIKGESAGRCRWRDDAPADFLGPDFDEIVDAAGCRLDSEIVLQCFGDSVVGPALLP